MATSIATPGIILVPAPILGSALVRVLVAGPSVSIVVQMGAVGHRTTTVAPLPTFTGWPRTDPDQHLSQFLMACIANNGRIEDVWLKWLLATLKDTTF